MRLTQLLKLLSLSSMLILTACGGGSSDDEGTSNGGNTVSDGNNDTSGTDGTGDDGTSETDNDSQGLLSFNLSGAVSVVTTENVATLITEKNSGNGLSKISIDGRKLNSFVFYNSPIKGQKLSKAQKGKTLKAEGYSDDTVSILADETTSNFFVINDQGDLEFAVESEYELKVSFTVFWTDITETEVATVGGGTEIERTETPYLFFAVDADNYWQSSSFIIAAGGCGIFKVNMDTSEWSCVEKGYLAANIDEYYSRKLSDNRRKPIQVDEHGNVYYLAKALDLEDYDGDGVVDNVNQSDWKKSLRLVPNGKDVGFALHADTINVSTFIPLNADSIVFEYNEDGDWQRKLKIVNNLSKVDPENGEFGSSLIINEEVYDDFFYAKDDSNTLIMGSNSEIELGRGDGAKFDSVKLGSGHNFIRFILGDDGALYGISQTYSYDDNGDSHSFAELRRILPYQDSVLLKIYIGDDWWDFFGNGKRELQISKGYAYYVEAQEDPSYKSRDVIKAVRLVDGETTTILGSDNSSEDWEANGYEVYNWKVSGDNLYFTGFDLRKNRSISGAINTLKIRQGDEVEEVYTITETASVVGDSNAIDDMEIIRSQAPDVFTGGIPKLVAFHTDQENLDSVSVEFNKYMDQETVEAAMSFTYKTLDTETEEYIDNEVDLVIPLWLGRNLHLTFDTDTTTKNNVTDQVNLTTESLLLNTDHILSFDADTIMDQEGFNLLSGHPEVVDNADHLLVHNWKTRPESGWYNGVVTRVDGITDGNVGKFAIKTSDYSGGYYYESEITTANLATVGYPLNHKVEFSKLGSSEFTTDLSLNDSHTLNWDNLDYSYEDDNDISWLRGESFYILADGNKEDDNFILLTDSTITDTEQETWKAAYDQLKSMYDIYTVTRVIEGDASSALVQSATSTGNWLYIPSHYVDNSTAKTRWVRSNNTLTEIGTDPLNPEVGRVYTMVEGHYYNSAEDFKYTYYLGEWRDADSKIVDTSDPDVSWIPDTWKDENNEDFNVVFNNTSEADLNLGYAPYYWTQVNVDTPLTVRSLDRDYVWLYYYSDLNVDNVIDLSGLCIFKHETNCEDDKYAEVGEGWGFNGSDWSWVADPRAENFVEKFDETQKLFVSRDQGSLGWSSDSTMFYALDPAQTDWLYLQNVSDFGDEDFVNLANWSTADKWYRYEYTFVSQDDETGDTKVTLNIYDENDAVVATNSHTIFIDHKELSWAYLSESTDDEYADKGFRFSLSLSNGSATIDNIRVTDMTGDEDEVLVNETFDSAANIFNSLSSTEEALD